MGREHFLSFRPATVAISLAAAALCVPALALVTKALVENLTPLSYTIHWWETVPLVVLATAFIVNGLLNERRAGREEKSG